MISSNSMVSAVVLGLSWFVPSAMMLSSTMMVSSFSLSCCWCHVHNLLCPLQLYIENITRKINITG